MKVLRSPGTVLSSEIMIRTNIALPFSWVKSVFRAVDVNNVSETYKQELDDQQLDF
jgi:hypothetical protein